MARENKVERVFVHCFMDGRDTPPDSGVDFIQALEKKMREYGVGQIATVIGRYYAMDRDNRWDRIEKSYRAMVHGESDAKFADPIAAIRASYEKGVTDEFVVPTVSPRTRAAETCRTARHNPRRRRRDLLQFPRRSRPRNHPRPRRTRLQGICRSRAPEKSFLRRHHAIRQSWPWLRYLIAPEKLEHILANVFAEQDYKNLRVAETEKYAHVTYFFNGGVEKPFPGEERVVVPSPKVPTYDLKPEMSAAGVADTVIHAIEKGNFDAIIMNFANADMVGHSGKLEATIKAVETVDECLGRIFQSLKPRGGAWIITADHGNAETMIDPVTGGAAHLSHHQSRPLHPAHGKRPHAINSRRLAPRHRPHAARRPRSPRAPRNVRPRPPPPQK